LLKQRAWEKGIKGAQDWVTAARKYGVKEATAPSFLAGTTHSAKGLEADNVIVTTSLPPTTAASLRLFRETRDEERRVSYVAATRAKKCLVVVDNLESSKGARASWMK